MIIQTIFNRMMIYDNQLDLIAGGGDVTRGLTVVNLVQDWIEMAAGAVADLFRTDQTFTTTASQDFTTWPASLLRMDALYLLDANGKQVRKLDPIDIAGGFAPGFPWPLDVFTGVVSFGAPFEFEGQQQGAKIRWNPTPDQVYTIRGYGLWAQADYAAAADTFLYPDSLALVVAPHAAAIMRIGLDRDFSAQQSAAEAAIKGAFKMFGKSVHTGPDSKVYEAYHDT